MECRTCGTQMARKINVDDIMLHWCPKCGSCRLVAPDLEDFQTWWTPAEARGRRSAASGSPLHEVPQDSTPSPATLTERQTTTQEAT